MAPAYGLLPGSERVPFTLPGLRQRSTTSEAARRAGRAGPAGVLKVLVAISAQALCRATPCWGPSRGAAIPLDGDDPADPFEDVLDKMQQSLLQTQHRQTEASAADAFAAERLLQSQQSLLETQQSLLQMQQSLLQTQVNQRPPPTAATGVAEPLGGTEGIDLQSLMQSGFEVVASPTGLVERLRALLRDGLRVGEPILRLMGAGGNLRGRRGEAPASGPELSRDVEVVTGNTSTPASRPDSAPEAVEAHLLRASGEAWQSPVVPRLYSFVAVVSTLLVLGLKGLQACRAQTKGDSSSDVAATRLQMSAAEVWGPVPRLLPEQPAKAPSFRERLAELAAPPPLQGRPLLA